MKIINYKKKEMMPLTDEEKGSYENKKVCYICEKIFCTDEENEKRFKKLQKVRGHCHYTGKYRGAPYSNSNLKYGTTKKIPVVFHNGSIYDYHFIIKQLVREFKYYLEFLGENTEKYITFSVPIKKEHDNGKTAKKEHNNGKTTKKQQGNGKKAKKPKTTTYRLKLIDNYRFISVPYQLL